MLCKRSTLWTYIHILVYSCRLSLLLTAAWLLFNPWHKPAEVWPVTSSSALDEVWKRRQLLCSTQLSLLVKPMSWKAVIVRAAHHIPVTAALPWYLWCTCVENALTRNTPFSGIVAKAIRAAPGCVSPTLPTFCSYSELAVCRAAILLCARLLCLVFPLSEAHHLLLCISESPELWLCGGQEWHILWLHWCYQALGCHLLPW